MMSCGETAIVMIPDIIIDAIEPRSSDIRYFNKIIHNFTRICIDYTRFNFMLRL